MATKLPNLTGALVPIAGPGGDIQWQGWTYGELLQHLNNDLDTGALDTSALSLSLRALGGSWIVPTLINAWTAGAGEPVGYLKDALGFVWMRGALNTGASGTTAFVLPPGYRPSESTYYASVQAGAAAGADIFVATTGDVQPAFTAATPRLNNVQFLAEL